MDYQYPVIFVHGIQGSWLKNQYPVNYQDEVYWTGIMRKDFEKLYLNTADTSIDRDFDKFIFAHQAVPFVYESIAGELREEATKYTYLFTYDWRKDNRISAALLGEFVKLVLKKAAIHYQQEDPPREAPKKVALVGHSMGGLVIKWYVTQILGREATSIVDKIVTIATPYRGSLKAVEALLPGARNFFGIESQKAMRSASRTLPGVYQLLPSWDDAVIDKKSGKALSIFNHGNWQDNLLTKLREEYGVEFFQRMLDDAKGFTDRMKEDYSPELAGRFYCAYGGGSETWRQVTVDREDGNWYAFDEIKKAGGEDKDGDGTVHGNSSIVKCAKTHKDVKQAIELGGQHAQMPNHGGVQDFVVSSLKKNEYIAPFASPR